jgi:SPP1 gp7 family putative phage head morphogenesis protein
MAAPLIEPGDTLHSPNALIQDRTIRRGFYRQTYANHLAAEGIGRFNIHGFPSIEERLDRGLRRVRRRGHDVTPRTHKALRQTLRRTDALSVEAFDNLEDYLEEELVDLAEEERDHTIGLWAMAFPGIALTAPTRRAIAAALKRRTLRGRTVHDWLRDIGSDERKGVHQAVQVGITRGERPGQIVQRVRGSWLSRKSDGVHGRTRQHLDVLLRGAATYAATHARDLLAGMNPEAMLKEMFVATLDAATCLECLSWHGQVFRFDEGPEPELHPRCRCERFPVGPGPVPEAPSYDTWLRAQPETVQKEALGATRAKLFRGGRIKVKSFVNTVGRTYTLKQLRAKDPDVFEAAGL